MINIILILSIFMFTACDEKVPQSTKHSAKIQEKIDLKSVVEKPIKWVSKFQNIDAKRLKQESLEDYKNKGKKKHYKRKKKNIK